MKTQASLLLLGVVAALAMTACENEVIYGDCGPQPSIEHSCGGGTLVCEGGEWVLQGESNCLTCPATQPADGTACGVVGQECSYGEEDVPCGNGTEPIVTECTEDGWMTWSTFCSPVECPEYLPSDGSSCDFIGQECSYEEYYDCGGESVIVEAECTEDGWMILAPFCLPEPICPETLPAAGSDCGGWDEAYYCDYAVACGDSEQYVTLSCNTGSYLWQLDSGPAECDSCTGGGDPAACGVIEGCQWLTPGCADEGQAAIDEGCYPQTDCSRTGCAEGDVCTPFIYDPCAGGNCGACGGEYGICVPPSPAGE